jgi:hypothetical protein
MRFQVTVELPPAREVENETDSANPEHAIDPSGTLRSKSLPISTRLSRRARKIALFLLYARWLSGSPA